MQATYISKGWTSGPHCYLALHSPNPADNGVWVMTPPTSPGTHAGACNNTRFGIEVVGDFQGSAPSPEQQQLLIDTLAALHRWTKIGPSLNAHRDCMAGRTCPGDAFYMLKASLQQRLAVALNGATPYTVRGVAVHEGPALSFPIALGGTAFLGTGDTVEIDEVKPGGWGHLSSGLGFVLLEQLRRS